MSVLTGARPYWALLSARVRMLLQYRAAAVAGFATQIFWGLIRIMVFAAFYRSTAAAQPLTLQQTVNYLWLTQALLLLLPFRIDSDLRAMMHDGSVAYELARPTDLYWLWYSRNLANRFAPMLLRAVPQFILAGLFFGLQPPASPASAAAFAVALGGALLLSTAIGNLMTISLMWTISGQGISNLISTVTLFLAGSFIPLAFFPAWSQPVLAWLPFRGTMDSPFLLYIGETPPEGLPAVLAHQLLWTVALVLLGRVLLTRGARRLVVQGG